jgi:hypothetical protein
MTLYRTSLFVAFGIFAAATFMTPPPASARTICRPDGYCFNTSGKPIPPWKQPANAAYGYGYYPYHHHRYWRHPY